MKKNFIKELFCGLTRFEKGLWLFSVIAITVSYMTCSEFMPITLIASLIGVTSLIFLAKGNVWGQALMIVFSALYAVISYKQRYYGELVTYLFMTLPTATAAMISWLRHPYRKGKNEVRIARLNTKKVTVLMLITLVVTVVFYYVLRYFNTANLFWSTVSVATSFFAASLTFMRSSYYALAYSLNDIILIVLWVSASLSSPGNLPMIACFAVFFINDLYGFFNWRIMQKKQSKGES